MLEIPAHPAVRDKLIIVHAGKGRTVQEEGLVALVQFEHGIGNAAEDGAAVDVELSEADGVGRDAPVQVGHGLDKGEVVAGDAVEAFGQAQREDGILREHGGFQEEIPVEAAVFGRYLQGYPQGVEGETLVRQAIRPDERDGFISPDAPGAPLDGCVDIGNKLMLVQGHEGVHHALHVGVVARHNGREHVLGGEYPAAAAQLLEVVFSGKRELAGLVATEHDFRLSVPFEFLVFESVGQVAGQAQLLGQVLGVASAQLQAEAFRVVVGEGAGPSAEFHAPGLHFNIIDDQGPGDTIDPFVHAAVLDAVHHLENAFFPRGEGIGTQFAPELVVSVDHIVHDDRVLLLLDLFVGDGPEDGFLIDHLAVSQEGYQLGIVAYRDGEVDEQVLFSVEPAAVGQSPVLDIHVDVADPVHVGGLGQLGVHRTDAEVFCINLHLAVQHGRSDQ